ncbi:hypothetical protein OSTOST_05634 [Ostertagia ostertagi]
MVLLRLLRPTKRLSQNASQCCNETKIVLQRQKLFPDVVVRILISIAFLLAVNAGVEITQSTDARRFSLVTLSWHQTDREYISMLSFVVYSSMIGLMFYALSIFDLLYKHIYDEEKHETAETTPKTQMLYQILHLACDVIFCLLIVLPRVDDPLANPNLAITHSLLNTFGPAVWPTISLIVYSKRVRHELYFRTVIMCRTCSSPNSSNIDNRRGRMRMV